MNSGKEKKKIRIIFLTIMMVFIVAAFSTAMYAASGNVQNDDNGGILDPFGLIMMSPTISVSDNTIYTIPSIKMTIRPKLRSHYRPPMN